MPSVRGKDQSDSSRIFSGVWTVTAYVIMENEDGTEQSVFPKTVENMQSKSHAFDVDGRPMKIIHEYEASSWNEAMKIANELQGFEPYVPMDDD
jgi:hypothetical protein